LTLDAPQLEGDYHSKPAQAASNDNRAAKSQPKTSTGAGNEVTVGRVGVVIAPKANIHKNRTSSRILATCVKDTPLGIVGEKGAWYSVLMIDMSAGWIRKDSVKLLDYDLVAARSGPANGSGVGQQAVQAALKYVGIPYVWGGSSWNGLDCSGFVKSVYGGFGVELPRVSKDQANVGVAVSNGDLQPGDRLYFACNGSGVDHTGIYMGSGLFIHASSRRGGVAVDNLASGFFARTFVSARRS
jgi:cell wall-associated NlpC family hydrolase